jgi:hypothetical protein
MKGNKTMWLILGTVLVIAVAFLVYRLVLKPSEAPSALIGLEPAGFGQAGLVGNQSNDEFFKLLLTLERIDLSDARQILPRLTTFMDFSVELEPQLPGRRNPFAPIGADPLSPPPPAETGTSTATTTP